MSTNVKRILYIPFDHLNCDYGVLKTADKATDQIVIVESARMTSGRPWHKERLFFLISSARHFAADLKDAGFKVSYLKSPTTIDGLKLAQTEFGKLPIFSAEPSSFVQYQQLAEFGVEFVPNDFFLTTRVDFEVWAGKQKSFLMETFYRAQRTRLNIMMDAGKPETGVWNFDKENRLPPPKNYTWPEYLEHKRDKIDLEVCAELGLDPTKTWATTRAGALAQLDHFIKHNLTNFGPYEDAVSNDSWALHHSLLSPYLNNGLLHASEVIAAALAKYKADQAPIASVEAFVRQIIGWREYLNGMYWHLGADYKFKNGLTAQRKLLPLFQNSTKTQMKCMQGIVSDIETRLGRITSPG